MPGPNSRTHDLDRLLAEEPFARSLVRSLFQDEVDEVVQQAYLQALESHAAIRAPRRWLARTLRNLVHNMRRSNRRRRAHEGAAAARRPLVPSSSELMEREERRRSLVRAVDQLAEPLRTIVLLRHFEDLPPRAIARQMDLPVTTVGNKLRQARALLRKCLDAEYGGPSRAWLAPLAPLAVPHPGLPSSPAPLDSLRTLFPEILPMTAKLKVAALASVLVAGAAVLLLHQPHAPSLPIGEPTVQQTTAQTALPPSETVLPFTGIETRQELLPVPPPVQHPGLITGRIADAAGGALPGAEVLVAVHRPDHGLFDTRDYQPPVRTDGSGRFNLGVPSFEDARVFLQVLHPHWAPLVTSRPAIGPRADLGELRLDPGGEVSVKVHDEAGQPVAGARIWLDPMGVNPLQMAQGTQARLSVTSDATGFGRLSGIPEGEYRPRAVAQNHGPTQGARFTLSPQQILELPDLSLPTASRLRGLVLGPGGPVPGARVSLDDAGPHFWSYRTETDDDGAFVFEHVRSGPLEVHVLASGFRPRTLAVPDPAHPLELRLEPVPTITGQVLDAATREPVERFAIHLRRPANQTAENTRPAMDHGTTPVLEAEAWEAGIQSALDSRDRLPRIRRSWPDGDSEIRVHDNGEFALPAPGDGPWVVEVHAPGWADLRSDPVGVTPGAPSPNLVLELGRGAVLSGTVRSNAGAPVPGASVRLLQPSGNTHLDIGHTVTDESGAFRLSSLPPAEGLLVVTAPNFLLCQEPVDLAVPQAHRDIRLEAAAILQGEVRGGPPVQVIVFSGLDFGEGPPSVQPLLRSVPVAADGRYRIEGLAPGAYWVRATAGDVLSVLRQEVLVRARGLPSEPDVVLEADSVTEYHLGAPWPGGGRVHGRITGMAGGLEGLRVSAVLLETTLPDSRDLQRATARLRTRTGPEGRYELGGLPWGTYEILLHDRFPHSRVLFRSQVDVQPGEEVILDHTLFVGGIRGQVVADEGVLPAVLDGRAESRDGSAEGFSFQVRDGWFVLDLLPEGVWVLRVGERETEVRVPAGTWQEVCLGSQFEWVKDRSRRLW